MRFDDLLEVIREDAQVIVVGEGLEKITASADVLHGVLNTEVLDSKVIEVSPVDKDTIQVWVNDNVHE